MRTTLGPDQIRELTKLPEARLLFRHAKLGIMTTLAGVILLVVLALVRSYVDSVGRLPEYIWGAILTVPVTGICMGIFTVFYEFYMRTTFANSMRSMYWAWDTGVTVFPTHEHAPNRKEVLEAAKVEVRLMSTTFKRYMTFVDPLVRQKALAGVRFRFVIYDPDSKAVDEKAREEGFPAHHFIDEIRTTCRSYLGPLTKEFPDRVSVRFCDFNTPFGVTVIDDSVMVLSLNIYGLARSKNQTPCLIIENKYDPDAVFKLYEESFEAIWKKLTDDIPESVKEHFAPRVLV